MPCAIINCSDNSIQAVIMALPSDPVPDGYVVGSILVDCPDGCNSTWTYDPINGFVAPPPPIPVLARKVDF